MGFKIRRDLLDTLRKALPLEGPREFSRQKRLSRMDAHEDRTRVTDGSGQTRDAGENAKRSSLRVSRKTDYP